MTECELKARTGYESTPTGQLPPNAMVVKSGQLVLCPFEDHDILCDPADDKIARKLLSGRHYQRRHIDMAVRVLEGEGRLSSGGLFVDIGANIGAMTIYALRSGVFRAALAMEPEPHNAAIFQRNMRLNVLADVVELVEGAATARAGRVELNLASKNLGAHSLERLVRASGAGTTTVEAFSVDEVIARRRSSERVALVKIDVEGHELAVLDGMVSILAEGTPLMIEVTFSGDPAARLEALRARLGSCYQTVVDLGLAEPAAPITPLALDAFIASDLQHDLLLF